MATLDLIDLGDENWGTRQNANLTILNNAKQEVSTLDEDVAAFMADEASDLSVAANDRYVVTRIWDGSAYPTRIAGAVNFFIGPVDPEAAMAGSDQWANPDVTTIAEIISELETPSSGLYDAVQTAARPETVEFTATDLASIDNRPVTLGTLSPSANMGGGVPVLLYPDASTSLAGTSWRTPVGWSTARFYLEWAHAVASPTANVDWVVQVTPGLEDGTALTSTSGAQVLSQSSSPAAIRIVTRMLFAGSITLDPAGGDVRLHVRRGSTTMGGSAGFIRLIAERTS